MRRCPSPNERGRISLWVWMFRLNYLGLRNMQTYLDGPKFYITPRKGPLLWVLRKLHRNAPYYGR